MIDVCARALLAAGFAVAIGRALWLIHSGAIVNRGRRLSAGLGAAMCVAPLVFWLSVLLTDPPTGDGLSLAAWLSRVAAAMWIAGTLLTQSIIAEAEAGRRDALRGVA